MGRIGRLLMVPTLVMLSATACGDDGPDAAPPPVTVEAPPETTPSNGAVDDSGADRDAAVPLDDVAVDRDAAVAAAVDLRVEGCGPRTGFGAGSVIGDRLVVTAAHVVAGAREVTATDVDGNSAAATVVHFDPQLDLALIRLDDALGRAIPVRSAEAERGEIGVIAVPRWSGDGLDLDVIDVEVVRTVNISTTDIYLDADVDRAGFEVAGTVDRGDSGALVVLPGGGVGIIWARSRTADGRAWAIDLPALVTGEVWSGDERPAVDVGPCIR